MLKYVHKLLDSKNRDYGIFSWTKAGDTEIDNSPNRYLFVKSTNIEDLSYCFRTSISGTCKLYSPEHEDGTIALDNGLFSPLKKLKSIQWMFYGYTYYVDRFVFRRKSGNYVLTNITRFSPNLIVDNINTLTRDDITLDYSNVTKLTTYGNLKGFFNNLPDLSIMNGFLERTAFINYNSMNDGEMIIPSSAIEIT